MLCSNFINELSIACNLMPDCYDGLMNLAIPIIICTKSEEFRILIREMLTKNGFFHVVEASNAEETNTLMKEEKHPFFTLIQLDNLSEEVLKTLGQNKSYIIIGQPDDPRTVNMAARLGVKHFLSFPFSSQMLVDKIQNILQ